VGYSGVINRKPMKTSLALCSLLVVGVSAFGGPDVIIKQRAKELSNENNVRQGVAPPSQPQPPPQIQTAPPPPPPSISSLQADLAAFKAGTTPTEQQKQKLANDIIAVAQGNKPSAAAAAKLADSLAAACCEKPLSAASRARLVQEIDAVLNPTKYPKANMDGIFADVQAIFQENGLDRKKAVEISDNLKALKA
jgi:hypothetical protein